jgi:hypothetical protein
MALVREGLVSNYFVGMEVEKSPAYGLKTLFVVGLQNSEEIIHMAKEIGVRHVYLGANKSFEPLPGWEKLVDAIIHEGFWVTLDYPIKHHEFVMEQMSQEMRHSRFIAMISVEIPNIEAYNYNTTIKLDDLDIDYSNPGVWCHRLHDLMDKDTFTQWDEYVGDKSL